MERRATSKDPVILAAAIRLITGPTLETTFGQVLHQLAEMLAIGKLPCSGHGEDVAIVVLSDETHGRAGGKARIGDDHKLASPGWRHKGLQHLAKQDILVPADAGIKQPQRHGDTKPVPTRH
jgi:hypothetical protein